MYVKSHREDKEPRFVVRFASGKEAQSEIKALQKQAADMEKRQSELTALFKRLYEDNVLGRITDEQFRLLSKDYTKEQSEIEEALPKAKERLQKLKGSAANIGRFLENARKYTEINELTCEILHIFIQRIEVGERSKRYSRSATAEASTAEKAKQSGCVIWHSPIWKQKD